MCMERGEREREKEKEELAAHDFGWLFDELNRTLCVLSVHMVSTLQFAAYMYVSFGLHGTHMDPNYEKFWRYGWRLNPIGITCSRKKSTPT